MTQSITYVPHGTIPDWRGFSPSIVAQRLGTQFRFFSNSFVCATEIYSEQQSASETLGIVRRIGPSPMYTRLFTKWTKLDPWPLDARLARICEQFKPAVVHAHQLEFPVERFLKRLSYRPKIVLHAHAVRDFDAGLGEADLYLPVSEYTRKLLIERGFPAAKTAVLYNGVDTRSFAPPSTEERSDLMQRIGADVLAANTPVNALVIGFVGRKEVDKGYLDFLIAVKTLQEAGYPVVGLSAGPTPRSTFDHPQWQEQEKLRQAMLNPADGHVRLIDLPAIPHKQVQSVYKLIDFFVFPSRFIGEQHPLALLEAMSCGCAVVTSPIASVRETVTPDQDGIILPEAWNAASLTQALRGLLDDPQRANKLRTQARTRALDFDWSRIAGQLEARYFSLTS